MAVNQWDEPKLDVRTKTNCYVVVNGQECPEFGWPNLGELCLEHYRSSVAGTAWKRLCLAEEEWKDVEHRMFVVECASGLRPNILKPKEIASTIESDDQRKRLFRDELRSAKLDRESRLPKLIPKRQRPGPAHYIIIDDDEEINNDI